MHKDSLGRMSMESLLDSRLSRFSNDGGGSGRFLFGRRASWAMKKTTTTRKTNTEIFKGGEGNESDRKAISFNRSLIPRVSFSVVVVERSMAVEWHACLLHNALVDGTNWRWIAGARVIGE